MRLSILPIMLMIGVATAVAQIQEATGPYRAEYLRDACKTLTQNTTNTPSGRAMAEGTCAGAISTVARLGPIMNDQFRFCPPQQATPQQVIPILLEFLDKNVGRLTWPCK
jgi:hypothetical protein